jgi:ferredoxin-NADP reductase
LRYFREKRLVPPQPVKAKVRSVRDVVPGVREIVLDSPVERVYFLPGQWLSFHLPVSERPPLIRAYSLAAPPAADGSIVLALDRVPDGIGSDYLFAVQPGDTLEFTGPLGRFTLPEDGSALLLLARYTGIVPFRAMLQFLAETPSPPPVTLLYSAARSEDLAYGDEIQALASRHSWLKVQFLVDESDDEGVASMLSALPELPDDRDSLTPMICGKRAFVRPLRDHFIERGWDRKAVRNESFD